MAKNKRKTFVAREELINQLSGIAKEKGFTLYQTVNEIFEVALKAETLNLNLQKIIEEQQMLNTARDAGFILGLESLWYDMAEISFKKAKDQALKIWFDAGVWIAKKYLTDSVDDSFDAFTQDFTAFTWNTPEFDIETGQNDVAVRVMSPRLPEGQTVLLASFLEGALSTFGYKIANKEVNRGIIRLQGNRKTVNAPK
jgi:hypothetical protein